MQLLQQKQITDERGKKTKENNRKQAKQSTKKMKLENVRKCLCNTRKIKHKVMKIKQLEVEAEKNSLNFFIAALKSLLSHVYSYKVEMHNTQWKMNEYCL